MGLGEAIRSAIEAIKVTVDDDLEEVEVLPSSGTDALGSPQSLPVPAIHRALVSRRQGLLPTSSGQEIRYKAVVSFLGPVTINPSDQVRLSDGMTGPIYVPHGGLQDPTTSEPYQRTIYIR